MGQSYRSRQVPLVDVVPPSADREPGADRSNDDDKTGNESPARPHTQKVGTSGPRLDRREVVAPPATEDSPRVVGGASALLFRPDFAHR